MNKKESTVVVESVAASAPRCADGEPSSTSCTHGRTMVYDGVVGSVCALYLSCMPSIASIVVRHAPLRSPLRLLESEATASACPEMVILRVAPKLFRCWHGRFLWLLIYRAMPLFVCPERSLSICWEDPAAFCCEFYWCCSSQEET